MATCSLKAQVLISFYVLGLAMGAITLAELEKWNKANPGLYKDTSLERPMYREFMKSTLQGQTFPYITGGMPVSCGRNLCTACFCWPHGPGWVRCLTTNHVRKQDEEEDHMNVHAGQPKGKIVKQDRMEVDVNVNGVKLSGKVVNYSSMDDWLVFEVPDSGPYVHQLLALMDGFDLTPITGVSAPRRSEAVWKLGFQTGMSVGRVTDLNAMHFFIDGIRSAPGDSGAAICLGELFTECRLVGMLLQGNETTQEVLALRLDAVPGLRTPLEKQPRWFEQLERAEKEKERAEKEKERAEKEKERAEKEKERAEKERAEKEKEKERAEKEKERAEKEKERERAEKEKERAEKEKERERADKEKALRELAEMRSQNTCVAPPSPGADVTSPSPGKPLPPTGANDTA